MRVAKWGNSLALRIPASVVEALQLKDGDDIEVHVGDPRQFGISRIAGRADHLTRVARRGSLKRFCALVG